MEVGHLLHLQMVQVTDHQMQFTGTNLTKVYTGRMLGQTQLIMTKVMLLEVLTMLTHMFVLLHILQNKLVQVKIDQTKIQQVTFGIY